MKDFVIPIELLFICSQYSTALRIFQKIKDFVIPMNFCVVNDVNCVYMVKRNNCPVNAEYYRYKMCLEKDKSCI